MLACFIFFGYETNLWLHANVLPNVSLLTIAYSCTYWHHISHFMQKPEFNIDAFNFWTSMSIKDVLNQFVSSFCHLYPTNTKVHINTRAPQPACLQLKETLYQTLAQHKLYLHQRYTCICSISYHEQLYLYLHNCLNLCTNLLLGAFAILLLKVNSKWDKTKYPIKLFTLYQ